MGLGHAPGNDVRVAPVLVNVTCPSTFYKGYWISLILSWIRTHPIKTTRGKPRDCWSVITISYMGKNRLYAVIVNNCNSLALNLITTSLSCQGESSSLPLEEDRRSTDTTVHGGSAWSQCEKRKGDSGTKEHCKVLQRGTENQVTEKCRSAFKESSWLFRSQGWVATGNGRSFAGRALERWQLDTIETSRSSEIC